MAEFLNIFGRVDFDGNLAPVNGQPIPKSFVGRLSVDGTQITGQILDHQNRVADLRGVLDPAHLDFDIRYPNTFPGYEQCFPVYFDLSPSQEGWSGKFIPHDLTRLPSGQALCRLVNPHEQS